MRSTAIKRRHRNSPRPAEKDAPQFKQWIRGCSCWCEWAGGCDGKIIAAHVDHAGGKGVSTKVADRHCIPLCGGPAGHHAEQHRIGWRSFEAKYELDAVKVAVRYWQAWPGRARWEERVEARNG